MQLFDTTNWFNNNKAFIAGVHILQIYGNLFPKFMRKLPQIDGYLFPKFMRKSRHVWIICI